MSSLPNRGKPYFLGWFADNERELRDLDRCVWSPHASAAFRASLERRYGDIAALNKAWGAVFTSFDDLAARRPEPALCAGPMHEDFRAFSRELLRRYHEILLRTIREEDPGRLAFTNRFMLGDVGSLTENLDLCRGYDAIAVNLYPANNSFGLAEHELAVLRLVHEKSGKPLLLGEWSVPARDSGLYNNPQKLDWSWPQTVATQRDRANQAARVQADFYNLPFMLGAHFFIWRDFDSAVRQANRGIFKASGEPWREIQDGLRQVNLRIQKLWGAASQCRRPFGGVRARKKPARPGLNFSHPCESLLLRTSLKYWPGGTARRVAGRQKARTSPALLPRPIHPIILRGN